MSRFTTMRPTLVSTAASVVLLSACAGYGPGDLRPGESEAELRARIAKRKLESNRADDEEDKLNKRVAVYFGKTIHVLPHYQKLGRLQTVNGIGNVDEIFENVCTHLDK